MSGNLRAIADTVRDAALDFFRKHSANYRFALRMDNPADAYVLADIAKFCHANDTTAVSSDPIQMAVREGRRQVWLRINRALNLTPEQQMFLSTLNQPPKG